MAVNPAFDGRGVTIGTDTGIDLNHLALRTTTTGERKVVDWVTATDLFDDGDPDLGQHAGPGQRRHLRVTYTSARRRRRLPTPRPRSAPTASASSTSATGASAARSAATSTATATRPAATASSWCSGDTATNNVYVDTNQNNSFADEQAMTDYRVRNDIGTFGTDNPATVREAMPFVVQTDGKNKVVNIGIVSGAHGRTSPASPRRTACSAAR